MHDHGMTPSRRAGGPRTGVRRRTAVALGLLAGLTISFLPSPGDAAPGAWSPTGKLATARRSHAAVRLPGGKVLVIGGQSSVGALASTEVYRPKVRNWAPAGSLITARYRHTATLLSDGRVLVVGGRSNSGPLSSAEVYDPADRTFSAAGTLTTGPRYWHTATLLEDGRVLVAGGLTGREVAFGNSGIRGELVSLQTAEVWSPSTGLFTAVGPLGDARDSHSATLLADGKVLVAGGYSVSSAEVFDPASSTWSTTGAMSVPRLDHTSSRLADGTVLVAGGTSPGGCCPTGSAERYDPGTGTWSPAEPMASPRAGHSATLLTSPSCTSNEPPPWCGRVLVAGGFSVAAGAATSQVFDAATGTWGSTALLGMARGGHVATLLKKGGKVLVTGGDGGEGPLRSAEIFAPPIE